MLVKLFGSDSPISYGGVATSTLLRHDWLVHGSGAFYKGGCSGAGYLFSEGAPRGFLRFPEVSLAAAAEINNTINCQKKAVFIHYQAITAKIKFKGLPPGGSSLDEASSGPGEAASVKRGSNWKGTTKGGRSRGSGNTAGGAYRFLSYARI